MASTKDLKEMFGYQVERTIIELIGYYINEIFIQNVCVVKMQV